MIDSPKLTSHSCLLCEGDNSLGWYWFFSEEISSYSHASTRPSFPPPSPELIRKYFRKVQDYLEGKKAGKELEKAIKVYKSHGRIFNEEPISAKNWYML